MGAALYSPFIHLAVSLLSFIHPWDELTRPLSFHIHLEDTINHSLLSLSGKTCLVRKIVGSGTVLNHDYSLLAVRSEFLAW